MFAFTLVSVMAVAVADFKSRTITSTPSVVVLVNAILDWSGDQLKLASLGFSGSPFT